MNVHWLHILIQWNIIFFKVGKWSYVTLRAFGKEKGTGKEWNDNLYNSINIHHLFMWLKINIQNIEYLYI